MGESSSLIYQLSNGTSRHRSFEVFCVADIEGCAMLWSIQKELPVSKLDDKRRRTQRGQSCLEDSHRLIS